MGKVVKCKRSQCRLFFTYTEKDTKCPFCKTEYGETVGEKPKDLPAGRQGKNEIAKIKKKSFEIWKDN